MAELGFNENPREKGKKMVDEASQQIENPTKIDQKDKKKEMSAVNKPEQSNVNPETPCMQEHTEKLSDMFKCIASKKKICKQLFKEGQPRTRLREKMQMEERAAQGDDKEIVVIEDAASEGIVHITEDKYSEEMEEFIDRQGVAGAIPEMFCTDKQNNFDEGSISRTVPEERDCSREEDIDITPELGQCQRSLQTYKEQTRYLQDINEKLLVA